MKKVFSLLVALALVVTLAACTPDTVYVEKEVPVEVKVPVEVEVLVPVEVPVEVIKTVPEYIYVDVPGETEYVNVPAEVENARLYKPGVYMNTTELGTDGTYTYAVVIIDAYGQIAGVMYDDTYTYSQFKMDADENLYVYVAGDKVSVPNTYRLVDVADAHAAYPTATDAITSDDLVEGIHNAKIAALTNVDVFETSRIVNEGFGGTNVTAKWIESADLLAAKIIEDQTTYGVQTAQALTATTATNVLDADGDAITLTNVDVLLALVQEILDGDAMKTADTVLANPLKPTYGLYTANAVEYGGLTTRVFSAKDAEINYYPTMVAVDEYGAIAGVYTDITYPGVDATVKSTKWILNTDYTLASGATYKSEMMLLADAVVKNQTASAFEETVVTSYDPDRTYVAGSKADTDSVAGVTVHVENSLVSLKAAVASALSYTLTDGIYYVENADNFMYVGIADGEIDLVYVDAVQVTDQATIVVDGDTFNLYTYQQQWLVGDILTTRDVLVYLDGTTYYSVNKMDNSNGATALAIGDRISFELTATDGIDEEATLEIVPGYGTKYIYDSAWEMQAELFAGEMVGGKTPYTLNFTADGTADNVDDLTMEVASLQQLLVDALLDSVEDTADIAADTAGELEIADLNKLANDVTAPTAIGTGVELAAGNYFVSGHADVDGQQFFAYIVVNANGLIDNMIVDATRFVDDEITTFIGLKDLEEPDTDLVDTDSDGIGDSESTEDDFYEIVWDALVTLVEGQLDGTVTTGSGLVAMAENGFGYTSRDSVKTLAVTSGVLDGLTYATQLAPLVTQLADEGLRAMVPQMADELGEIFIDFSRIYQDSTGTATSYMANVLYAGEVIDIDLDGDSYAALLGTSLTAKFTAEIDSSDRDVIVVTTTADAEKLTAQDDITGNSTATVTLTLEWDDTLYTYEAPYEVKTLVSYNNLVLDHAEWSTAAYGTGSYWNAETSLGGEIGENIGSLAKLDGLVTYSGATPVTLISGLGIITSGTTAIAEGTATTSGNVVWYVNYGKTTGEAEINTLTDLPIGTSTITAVVQYDTGTDTAQTPVVLTRDFSVTILSQADALARVIAEIKPANLVNNGEATEVQFDLMTESEIVEGVTIDWTLINTSGNPVVTLDWADLSDSATDSDSLYDTLDLVRMYTQNKVVLKATVQEISLSGNTKTFEFRVMPYSVSKIEERLTADIANVFETAPSFYDISGMSQGSGIDVLSGLLEVNSTYLSEDSASAEITWTLSSTASTLVNQGSGVSDSGANIIYIESGTTNLNLGGVEFWGDVTITVTAKVALDTDDDGEYDDVSVTDSFDITLFNQIETVATTIVITSGNSGIIDLSAIDLNGRTLNSDVTYTITSGATAIGSFTIAKSSGLETITIESSGISFEDGITALSNGVTYDVEQSFSYKYYLNSVETSAVVAFKNELSDTVE